MTEHLGTSPQASEIDFIGTYPIRPEQGSRNRTYRMPARHEM
jgi:hypothetical protein